MMRQTLPALAALAFAATGFAHEASTDMAAAAGDFLKSLDAEQLKKASYELNDAERTNWHYIPLERKGLPLREMRPEQQHLAHGLLSTGLSNSGYLKATQIMSLERILWELENQSARRDPEYYLVWIFGTPDAKGTWGWRFEGHHLSLNFTIVNGQLISETPAFWAANPGKVASGPREGLRVLGGVEDTARTLVKSLNDAQKAKAIVMEKAPDDILTKDLQQAEPLEDKGLPFSELDEAQKKTFWALVGEVVNNHRASLAAEELKRIEGETGQVKFAWGGGLEFGEGHYFRIQGKTFLLEYDNIQNGAMHPHLAWRNFGEDFGRDLLREHLKTAHASK